MWLLILIFLIVTTTLGWTMFGYIIFVWFLGLLRRRKELILPDKWPMVTVIISCFNEEGQILPKIENTKTLDYPRDRMEVIFADGGSEDDTVRLLTDAVRDDECMRIVHCSERGKIHQLNEALSLARGEIIVNTDADALLSADTLQWIAAEFARADNVWAVGAYSRPAQHYKVDRYYWDTQNKARFLESDGFTSSIVVAPCYAFRRELLDRFPSDVVADDIYVAFLANTRGYTSVYSRKALALELRTPRTLAEFVPHKYRKSNAFLRESLRFLYRLPEMGTLFKVIFLTRVAQQLLLPWMILWWVLLAGALCTLFRIDVVFFGTAFLVILLAMANRVFASVELPDGKQAFAFTTALKGFTLATSVLLATGLSYPFFRQGSSYPRFTSIRSDGGEPSQSGETEKPHA